MAFCGKCGTKVDEGIKFCPGCGNAMEIPAPEQQAVPAQEQPNQAASEQAKETGNGFVNKVKNLNNTADETASFDDKDISDNKGITILSYLGPLVFVPMFARKSSPFARFHANQGLLLLIADVAYSVIQVILMAILRAIFPWNWNYGYFGGRGFVFDALSTILSLVWIVFGVLVVIGIINVARGKAKELPIIGKFKILK